MALPVLPATDERSIRRLHISVDYTTSPVQISVKDADCRCIQGQIHGGHKYRQVMLNYTFDSDCGAVISTLNWDSFQVK